MKTILFVESATTFGGSSISLYTLVKYLNKAEFKPIVVTNSLNKEDYFTSEVTPDDVILCSIKMYQPWVNNSIWKFVTKKFPKLAAIGRYLFWAGLVTAFDTVRYVYLGLKYKVDAIHINNGFGYSLAISIAAAILKVPCISHFRDVSYAYGGFFGVSRKLVKYVIAISNDTQCQVTNQLGVPSDQITVIWNGVDQYKFKKNLPVQYLKDEFNLGSERLIGIPGRIVEWKGLEDFISAIEVVRLQVPDLKAFIIGNGEKHYVDKLKLLVKEKNLEDVIVFTGYRKDIPNLIYLMDVIVNTSIRPEPFGRTITEAMALGIPVVAYAAGGILDQVINNETGKLVKPRDIKSLGRDIASILLDRDLASRLSSKSKSRFNRLFTGNAMSSKVEEFYHNKVFTKTTDRHN